MNLFSKKVWTIFGGICIAIFLFTPSAAFALKFKHIVAFGDSLSDYNNLHTYFPEDMPVARTNGATWVMYLADELNASLDNNAFIGAMTREHLYNDIQLLSDSGAVPQFGLVSQVNRYLSENNAFEPSETLFTVWIGANNLIKFGYGELGPDPAVMIGDAMVDIGFALSALISNGAMHIVILTLPDIGKSPWYIDPKMNRTEEEIAGATLLASTYNYFLLQTVGQMMMAYPEVTFYQFDLFQIMDDIEKKNIFPNTTGSYMKLNDEGFALTETNGPAEDYLFYDAVHPTTRAHEYFAKEVAQHVLFYGYISQQELEEAVLAERMKWDMKNDNRIGLEEAIHALKTCSGMTTNH